MRGVPNAVAKRLGWMLAVLVGCTSTAPAPSVPAASVPEETPSQSQQPSPPEDSEPEPILIGWSEAVARPSSEAIRLNSAALVKHRGGDYAGSRSGFSSATKIAPEYALARYNLACAEARLGDLAAAASILAELLASDLPRFRPRFFNDEDLQTLRDGPEGAAIANQLLPKLTKAYAEALQRGAPAMMYIERSDSSDSGGSLAHPQVPYTHLRIGVYDGEAKRFVPMTPPVGRAYSGVLDLAHKRAIVATGQLRRKDMWEIQPHAARASMFSLEKFGDSILEAKHVSPPGDVFYGFELWVGPSNTLYGTQTGNSYAWSVDYYKWSGKRRRKIGWTGEVGNGPEPKPPTEIPYDGPSVQVIDIAKAIYRRPHNATLRRRSVALRRTDKKVRLERGHHEQAEIIASPDPLVFVVVSNTIRFSLDGGEEDTPTTLDRYVVDLVDMHKLEATRLAKAPGYAHAVWAPDGTLFVDAPDGVSRYAPGTATPKQDVMPGVRFGTPPLPETGGV